MRSSNFLPSVYAHPALAAPYTRPFQTGLQSDAWDLTPAEKEILDFTSGAIHDLGWEPHFHCIEWAASDAYALRQNITLGAGENLEHSRGEYVHIGDMVKSTQLVRQLVKKAAECV